MASPLDKITDETIQALIKSQTSGINTTLGLTGYDLSGVVSLVPTTTIMRDRIARNPGNMGSTSTHWQAFRSMNNAQPNPFTGWDGGGSLVQFDRVDLSSAYFPVRTAGRVTRDAETLARGWDNARQRAQIGTLMQWKMMDNKAILGGQNYGLPSLALAGTALSTATSGGSIAATTTVYVAVQARSAYNWYYGGSGVRVAANIATGAGATNSVTINSWPSVAGAVAYDIFVGPAAGTLYYVTTQTHNGAYTITSIPGANATVPVLPALNTTVPTLNTTTDSSFNANAFNGLLASIVGDYNFSAGGVQVTPGTGSSPSGAYVTSLGGATLNGSGQSITQIDTLLATYFGATNESPDIMVMNGQQALDIKNRITATSVATTMLEPDANGRVGMTAGGSFLHYINGVAGGQIIDLVVEPHLPPGRILFLKETVPFPDAGVASTFEVRTLQEVAITPQPVPRVAGAGGGPAEEWDISSAETFVNHAPMLCGMLTDIAAG